MSDYTITEQEAKAIIAIKNGADIWGYGEASELRNMQRRGVPVNQQQGKDTKRSPHRIMEGALFTITDAMQAPKNGAARQPYFGAIATPHGLKVARKVLKEAKAAKAAKAAKL